MLSAIGFTPGDCSSSFIGPRLAEVRAVDEEEEVEESEDDGIEVVPPAETFEDDDFDDEFDDDFEEEFDGEELDDEGDDEEDEDEFDKD